MRRDAFEFIEMFQAETRKHIWKGEPLPVQFERQPELKAKGIQKTCDTSKNSLCNDPSVMDFHNSICIAARTGRP